MTAPLAPTRLLYVEDDAALAEVMVLLLARSGYETVWVCTARRALAELGPDGGGYAAVVTDYRLADGEALEFVRQIRALPFTRRVVVVSGSDEPGLGEALRHAGADVVLPKPVAVDTLLAALPTG